MFVWDMDWMREYCTNVPNFNTRRNSYNIFCIINLRTPRNSLKLHACNSNIRNFALGRQVLMAYSKSVVLYCLPQILKVETILNKACIHSFRNYQSQSVPR